MISFHELEKKLKNFEQKGTHSLKYFEPFRKTFIDKDRGIELFWNSRSHRKGVHPFIKLIHCNVFDKVLEHNKKLIWWKSETWNISWWVAQYFFWGSVVWTFNGIIAMWPVENLYLQNLLSGWSAFLGGLVFIFGGYSAFLESINQKRTINLCHLVVLSNNETNANLEKKRYYIQKLKLKNEQRLAKHQRRDAEEHWQWFAVNTKNWGWLLNTAQLIGAIIFFISCVTAVPGVLPNLIGVENNYYWLPQIIGASFFIIASWMAMREVQINFFQIRINNLSWNVGLWNLIGAIGFFLSGYFGLITNGINNSTELAYWGAAFSTFWGSIAFLIAAYLLLIEILNRN